MPLIEYGAVYLILIVGLMVAFQYFLRKIFFNRDVNVLESYDKQLILYPCDGRLAYTRSVEGEAYAQKKQNKISIGFQDEKCYHVGVYMSPYDRHFVVAPLRGRIKKIEKVNAGVHWPMLDLLEYAKSGFWMSFDNWFNRKFDKYLKDNEKVVITIAPRPYREIKVVLIGDKCVNKIDIFCSEGDWVRKGDKLGFIRRGSQVDLLIPEVLMDFRVPKKIGAKIKAGDKFGRLHD